MSSKTSTSLTRTLCIAAASWVCLAGVVIAQDAAPGEDIERFRADLIAYVDDMAALPYSMLEAFHEDPWVLPEARAEIASMPPDELRRIRDALEAVPFWRSLPGVLATALPNESYFNPLELAARLDPAQVLRSAQRSTQPLDDLVARLEELPERLPADALPPDYRRRVASLEARLRGLPPFEVSILRQRINARVPAWQEKLQASKRAVQSAGAAPAVTANKDHCDPSSSNCGSMSFPNDVLCELDAIIDEIAAIPCRVGEFAVSAANFIIDQLEALLSLASDLLPSTEEIEDAVFSVLSADLSDPTWAMSLFAPVNDKVRVPRGGANAVDPVFAIPCPVAFGDAPDFVDSVSFPVLDFLIGAFGDQVAANRCYRRFVFLPEAIADLVPKDTLTTPARIAVAAIPSILKYLCNCYDAASDINFDDNQQVHRDDVATRLCKVEDDDCEGWNRFSAINGRIDLNLDGIIGSGDFGKVSAAIFDDEGEALDQISIFFGWLDFDNNDVINSNDSGTFNGFPVEDGELDVNGNGTYGGDNDDGVVGETLVDDYFVKVSDLAQRSGTCDTAAGDVTADCILEKVGDFADGAYEAGSIRRQVDDLDGDVAALNDDLDDLDVDVAAVSQTLATSVQDSDDLSADLEAFRNLALQLRIEADLIRDADQRIGLFQLPAAVCSASDPEVCGLIEVAQAVLTEAITLREQAGREVSLALFYLERGNNLYQEGAYKKAYTEYRNAYRELVLTRN